jgi:hypothetical protein
MFDIERSYSSDNKDRPILHGAIVGEMGSLYVYVPNGDGSRSVQMCSAVPNQVIAGWSVCDAKKVYTETVIEEFTIPAIVGGITFLNHQHIITSSERVMSSITGLLTQDIGPAPGPGRYNLVNSTGAVEFNMAQVHETVTIQYRYELTYEEIQSTYYERILNNRAQDYFSQVSLYCGDGEIFTTIYDTSAAYNVNDLLYTAANGAVSTVDNGGYTIVGRVSLAPSSSSGFLGIKYNF